MAFFSKNNRALHLFLLLVMLCGASMAAAQSDEYKSLLKVKELLQQPKALKDWNTSTDFCNLTATQSVTIVCYEGAITQLEITGDKGCNACNKNGGNGPSMEAVLAEVGRLSKLKVLSLRSLGLHGTLLAGAIAALSSQQLVILNLTCNCVAGEIPQELSLQRALQTLILDRNRLNGALPDWISALPSLTFLSCAFNNLTGPLPDSVAALDNLRVLRLAGNALSGDLPDLMPLSNLQELDLEGNSLGPLFPNLAAKIENLKLSRNNFRFHVPDLHYCIRLQKLDLSRNEFIGQPPASVFSLPALSLLNLSFNSFSGSLPLNLTCSSSLDTVDLSSNLLTGKVPACLETLAKKKKKHVDLYGNCLDTQTQTQHPFLYCKNAATATAGVLRRHKLKVRATTMKVAVILGIVGGAVAVLAALGLALLLLLRISENHRPKEPSARKSKSEISSTGFSSEMLTNARYISQTMRLGALGLPQYRPFALEELEAATHNFSSVLLLGKGSQGELYKGSLQDGTVVTIRCLNCEWKHGIHILKPHLELLSKLRHRHLVSLLGHCIDYDSDGSRVKRIFLIFEFVSNGTLRSNLCGKSEREKLTWSQRLAAVIGVAKGIHFLHTGAVPGIYDNNLKATNIMLDQNIVSKLKCYNLPILAEDMDDFEVKIDNHRLPQKDPEYLNRRKLTDKVDIYHFGLILLEAILGRPPAMKRKEADTVQDLLNLMTDVEARTQLIDPVILQTCTDESLETVIEITSKCLSSNVASRPSVEDVLWNLQYAAQVQETSGADL